MKRAPLTVGIIANPASGRDVRRLTANAGLFSSTDKVSVIQRLLAAFGATGITQVLMPTDMTGIAAAEMVMGLQSDATRHFAQEAEPTKLPPKPFSTIGANVFLRFKEWRAGKE